MNRIGFRLVSWGNPVNPVNNRQRRDPLHLTTGRSFAARIFTIFTIKRLTAVNNNIASDLRPLLNCDMRPAGELLRSA
jgi:hypothetical protein